MYNRSVHEAIKAHYGRLKGIFGKFSRAYRVCELRSGLSRALHCFGIIVCIAVEGAGQRLPNGHD